MPNTTQAVGFGIIMLFVAFVFPTLVAAPDSGTLEEKVTLNDGDGGTENLEDSLLFVVESQTSKEVVLNVTSLESGDGQQVTIPEGGNETIVLDGYDITVEVLEIDGNSGDVILSVTRPADFDWDNDLQSLSQELPIVFVALAGILVVGVITRVVR